MARSAILIAPADEVFAAFPREYQLLVADDGSTDATAEVLAPYARVLPLTVLRHDRQLGYAATVEELLRSMVAAARELPTREEQIPAYEAISAQIAEILVREHI